MDVSELDVGALIEGPKWPEPVEIKKVDRLGDGAAIIGSMMPSGRYIDAILSNEELAHISLKRIDCDFSGRPRRVFLALESVRYRFASMYDPLLAMNASKIDPLPHQIDAVYGHVLKMPKIRYLLAHDPGAGKTIMAGLIIKEMKLRHLVKRILVVAPGHLKDQWRRELKDKFEEAFVVADRGTFDAQYGENVWHKESQIITSMDFAKRNEITGSLQSAQFDMVIVDEAHKMAAYRYGDKIYKSARYRLGEILSANSVHLLFLTATPHKGDNENFRLFVDLLEPGIFATPEMLEEFLARSENAMFLRQIKEDMRDFDGKPLFLPRHVSTPAYELSDPEYDLYRRMTDYVRNQFGKALSPDKKRNIGFALMVLQRRLASSSYALRQSLQRRRDRLSYMLSNFERFKRQAPSTFDFEEIDDMDEGERWEQERIGEMLSIAQNRDELKREIRTLGELVEAAGTVIEGEHEVKLEKLKETMKDGRIDVGAKILIFTESRDTLEYLERRVRSWGYEVSTIHGGMKLEDRIKAEGEFRNKSRVMIATEAAGEGINLQFCHIMINYDIPWNPNRLEQRMGRVHRYGQKYEVFVYNLIARDTIEGKIFRRLFEKLDEIRSKMGNDRVFDIIGEIYHGKNLAQLLADAAMGAKTEEEILGEMEIAVDEDYIRKIRRDLGDTLATRNIDFVQLGSIKERARENRLMPEYTADFFVRAFAEAGGKVRRRQTSLHAIVSIPYQIRAMARENQFKKSFGSLPNSYPKITFDKDVGPKDQDAEFLTFGHPLFEAVLEWITEEFAADLQRGAVFVDRSGQLDGTVLFFEGVVNDGTGYVAGKRLFSYYVDSGTGKAEHIPPSILWDLDDSSNVTAGGPIDLEDHKAAVREGVIRALREYQKELLKERERQARIKEKYGIRSLEKLIRDHDADLLSLRERQVMGENTDIAIRGKEERQRQYIDSKKRLADLIERERNLTVGAPRLLGAVRVIPSDVVPDAMRENSESEQAAMAAAMAFERARGREPVDVSGTVGLGYDIKSVGGGETRYIEVKGRRAEGMVALTRNEWFKAKHLAGDYYLYVVWNTKDYQKSDLRPLVIRDPAHNTSPRADVHYLINADEIRSKAE